MICNICGSEFHAEVCPNCGTAQGVSAGMQPEGGSPSAQYQQYDYFPNRENHRNMQFGMPQVKTETIRSGELPPMDRGVHLHTQPQPEPSRPFTAAPAADTWHQPQPSAPAPDAWHPPHPQNTQPFARVSLEKDSDTGHGSKPYSSEGSHAAFKNTYPQSSGMPCPRCGRPVWGAYCGACGYRVQPPVDGWYAQGGYPAPMQVKKDSNGWIIALAAVLGFVFVVLPVILLIAFSLVFTHSVRNYVDRYGYEYGYEEEYEEEYEEDDDYYDEDSYEDGIEQGVSPEDIPDDAGESIYPQGVSNQEYKLLSDGMTYSEVSAIIGGDGETREVDDEGGFTAVWPGEYKTDAVITIEFQDNRVIDINQNGLF